MYQKVQQCKHKIDKHTHTQTQAQAHLHSFTLKSTDFSLIIHANSAKLKKKENLHTIEFRCSTLTLKLHKVAKKSFIFFKGTNFFKSAKYRKKKSVKDTIKCIKWYLNKNHPSKRNKHTHSPDSIRLEGKLHLTSRYFTGSLNLISGRE